jgi:hypothetical protein
MKQVTRADAEQVARALSVIRSIFARRSLRSLKLHQCVSEVSANDQPAELRGLGRLMSFTLMLSLLVLLPNLDTVDGQGSSPDLCTLLPPDMGQPGLTRTCDYCSGSYGAGTGSFLLRYFPSPIEARNWVKNEKRTHGNLQGSRRNHLSDNRSRHSWPG